MLKQPSLPEPRVVKFSSLMADIESGKIKIPQFQRHFVWDMKTSAKLLDSIVKGYPIGTFIMWHTDERLRAVRNIGNIRLPEPNENEYVDFVLDGQQRITSIFAALKGERIERKDGKKEDFSEIIVDLDADLDDNIIATKSEINDGHTEIPLKDLLYGGVKLYRDFDDEYHKKLDEYRESIQSYNYSVIQVRNASLDVAAEIFTRTNVGGKPLSIFQIMVAKTYDHEKEFDLAEKFDELVEKLRTVGYETLPDTTVLHLISLILKNEVRKKTILSLHKDEVIDSWEQVVDAIWRAVDYLRSYYRIPVSKLLPYDSLVVLLAYFFYKNDDKPDVRQDKYLADLFWRISLSERYSGSSDTYLVQDIKRVNKILEYQQPEYDWSIDTSPKYIKRNGEFKVGRSFTKAIICIYAYYEPKSFKNNANVIIGNDYLKSMNSKNYHHFFPKSYLKGKGLEQESNSVLNITIVDDYLNKQEIRNRAPSDYMKEFRKENKSLSQTMKTHLIHNLDEFGVWDDNYEKFLNKRAIAVHEAINERIIQQDGESFIPNTIELGTNTNDKSLHTTKYVKGMECPLNMIRPDKQVSIKSWLDVLYNVADYLVNHGHLNHAHCPIPIGKENALLHTKPVHQNGKSFSAQRKVGELYLNTNASPNSAIKYAIKLIDVAKMNPGDFRLIFNSRNAT